MIDCSFIKVELVHLEQIGDWVVMNNDLWEVSLKVLGLRKALDDEDGDILIEIGLVQEIDENSLALLFSC